MQNCLWIAAVSETVQVTHDEADFRTYRDLWWVHMLQQTICPDHSDARNMGKHAAWQGAIHTCQKSLLTGTTVHATMRCFQAPLRAQIGPALVWL